MLLMLAFRWYDVDFTMAEELVWGRGQGCDFVTQSCLQIITDQFQQKYEGNVYVYNSSCHVDLIDPGFVLVTCCMLKLHKP